MQADKVYIFLLGSFKMLAVYYFQSHGINEATIKYNKNKTTQEKKKNGKKSLMGKCEEKPKDIKGRNQE